MRLPGRSPAPAPRLHKPASDPLEPGVDPAVQTILNGLRSVDPPQGLEARMLSTLESSRTISSAPAAVAGSSIDALAGTTSFATRRRLPERVALLAVLGIAAAALFVVTLAPSRHVIGDGASRRSSAFQPATVLAPSPSQPRPTPATVVARPARRPPRTPRQPVAAAPPPPPSHAALSFPAPPLPLTTQEQLLLRAVHRPRGTEELALLNPAVRNRLEAADRTQFDDFFPAVPLLVSVKASH